MVFLMQFLVEKGWVFLIWGANGLQKPPNLMVQVVITSVPFLGKLSHTCDKNSGV
jgi:hypothetical protein